MCIYLQVNVLFDKSAISGTLRTESYAYTHFIERSRKMKSIRYRKGNAKITIEAIQEMDLSKTPNTAIEHYEAFFVDVPLYSGQEWKSLEVPEIVEIFLEARAEIQALLESRVKDSIERHNNRNWFFRKWLEYRGWKAPITPSLKDITTAMCSRCENLAEWMAVNSQRPFYRDSDMSYFVVKPRAVSKALREAE